MSKQILNVATLGILGSVLKPFGKDKAAPAPAALTPTVMPAADDAAIKLARKRSIAAQMGRKGRDSTILTGDTLGG